MGQSTFANGFTRFNNIDNAIDAHGRFQDWAREKNALKDVNFCIQNINLEDTNNGISYMVSSTKYENCEWQCEEVRDFFKDQEGCERVEQDILVQEDSVNWSKEDNED